MKTSIVIASLGLVFAASGAWAQEATVEPGVAKAQANTPLTREAVRAEAIAALKSGEIARRNAEAWQFDRQLPAADATRLARTTR